MYLNTKQRILILFIHYFWMCLIYRCDGYCFAGPIKSKLTASKRLRYFCEFTKEPGQRLMLLPGSTFSTGDSCLRCTCTMNGLQCCGFGRESAVVRVPDDCRKIIDGCQYLYVKKNNESLDCFTGKPIDYSNVGTPHPDNYIRPSRHDVQTEPQVPSTSQSSQTIHMPIQQQLLNFMKAHGVETKQVPSGVRSQTFVLDNLGPMVTALESTPSTGGHQWRKVNVETQKPVHLNLHDVMKSLGMDPKHAPAGATFQTSMLNKISPTTAEQQWRQASVETQKPAHLNLDDVMKSLGMDPKHAPAGATFQTSMLNKISPTTAGQQWRQVSVETQKPVHLNLDDVMKSLGMDPKHAPAGATFQTSMLNKISPTTAGHKWRQVSVETQKPVHLNLADVMKSLGMDHKHTPAGAPVQTKTTGGQQWRHVSVATQPLHNVSNTIPQDFLLPWFPFAY